MHAHTVLGISNNLAMFGGASDKETWGFDPWVGKTLQQEMAAYSSILAWKHPWTKEPGGLQFRGLQKIWTRLNS